MTRGAWVVTKPSAVRSEPPTEFASANAVKPAQVAITPTEAKVASSAGVGSMDGDSGTRWELYLQWLLGWIPLEAPLTTHHCRNHHKQQWSTQECKIKLLGVCGGWPNHQGWVHPQTPQQPNWLVGVSNCRSHSHLSQNGTSDRSSHPPYQWHTLMLHTHKCFFNQTLLRSSSFEESELLSSQSFCWHHHRHHQIANPKGTTSPLKAARTNLSWSSCWRLNNMLCCGRCRTGSRPPWSSQVSVPKFRIRYKNQRIRGKIVAVCVARTTSFIA